jgi:hypothetical protein
MANQPRSRYNLEVTDSDIEKARIGDSFKCVVSQAIARQVPNAHHIEVDTQTVRWSDEDGRHVFLTPYEIGGYVVAFDAGDELHPFRFHLRDAVPSVQKRAVSRTARRANKSRDKIRTERQRIATAQAVLASPDASPAKIAVAQERIEAGPARIAEAQVAHEELKAAYKAAGESSAKERVSETTRRAPPRVFKLKRRIYGMRALRVNQAEGRKHYA